MNSRTLVAALTLAALPAITLLGHSAQVAHHLTNWAYAWGMSGWDLGAFAIASAATCLPMAGLGAAVCLVVGGA